MPQGVPAQSQEGHRLIPEGLYGLPDDLIEAIDPAPDHKGRFRSVPQSADQKDDQLIAIFPGRSLSAASQGDIQIVLEPGGQGDMPSAPELAHRPGQIGSGEILHQPDPQNLCRAHGDDRVPVKIAVDLKGEGAGGQHQDAALIAAH